MARAANLEVQEIRATPEELVVSWKDTTYSAYQALWLRDNDPAHRDASTGLRLISLTSLPADPRIEAAEQTPPGHITLRWQDGASSVFPLLWFRKADRERRIRARPMRLPWMGQPIDNFAWCSYAEWIADPAKREDWLYRAGRDGVAFLRDVPAESQFVLQVAALIGFVRETHEGRVFAEHSFAPPDQSVKVRTDAPYRDPAPGFLLLHCLASAGHGGEIVFVDGLAAAERLRTRNAEAFAVLTQDTVYYRSQTAGQDFTAERPMIEVDPHGHFRAIYYDDCSIAPFPFQPGPLRRYYAANRALALLMAEPDRLVKHPWRPGDMALVDNSRVLHCQRSLPAEVAPLIEGCYLEADGLYSALAVLARKEGIA